MWLCAHITHEFALSRCNAEEESETRELCRAPYPRTRSVVSAAAISSGRGGRLFLNPFVLFFFIYIAKDAASVHILK